MVSDNETSKMTHSLNGKMHPVACHAATAMEAILETSWDAVPADEAADYLASMLSLMMQLAANALYKQADYMVPEGKEISSLGTLESHIEVPGRDDPSVIDLRLHLGTDMRTFHKSRGL